MRLHACSAVQISQAQASVRRRGGVRTCTSADEVALLPVQPQLAAGFYERLHFCTVAHLQHAAGMTGVYTAACLQQSDAQAALVRHPGVTQRSNSATDNDDIVGLLAQHIPPGELQTGVNRVCSGPVG